MKKFLIVVIIAAVVVAGVGLYVLLGTPSQGRGVRFPLSEADRALVAKVPSTADAFALVPNAAVLQGKLEGNPVTREALRRFAERQPMPRAWMIGSGDLLMWRSGKETSYLLQLDPLRAFLVRSYLTLTAGPRASRVMLAAPVGEGIPQEELDQILKLTDKLPPGDALAVQRDGGRGAFPPIGRPAVTSISVTPLTVDVFSRATRADAPGTAGVPPASGGREARDPTAPPESSPTLLPRFPRGALLTAAFASPPRVLGDLKRLLGLDVSALLRDGGSVALYDVDSGKLLPRPRGVIILPNTPERKAQLQRFQDEHLPRGVTEALGFTMESTEIGSELIVAFDRESIPRYKSDSFDQAQLAANVWSIRLDPRRAGPVLDRVASNTGLRFLTPRVHRAAKDLMGWIGGLERAEVVEAGAAVEAGAEQLRVRITSK